MQLKVLMDSPAASELVSVHHNEAGLPVYTATVAGNIVVARYRALYGGQSNVKKHDLPRRVLAPRLKKQGLAAFKRERKQQQEEEPVAIDPAAADDLQAETNRSAAERQTAGQLKLLESLQQEAKAAEFDNVSIKKKLAAHRKAQLQTQADIAKQELRELSVQPSCLHGDCIVVVVASRSAANKPLFDSLADAGGNVRVFDVEEVMKSIPDLLEKQLVWVFPSAEKMSAFVGPVGVGHCIEQAKSDAIRKLAVASAIRHLLPRLVGGYIAGTSWLQVQQEMAIGLRG